MKQINMKLLAILIFAAVVIPTAAIAGRYLKGNLGGDSQTAPLVKQGDGYARQGNFIDVRPSALLPAGSPDAGGVLVERKDNLLFVGTGLLSAYKNELGAWEMRHDGPVVEVVITQLTEIYRDDTLRMLEGEGPNGSMDQALGPGTLAEIAGRDLYISAWGEKRDDRLIARVLVYQPSA